MGIERSCLSNAFALQGLLLRPAALGTEGQLREEPRGAPQDPAQGSSLEVLAAFDVASVCTHADNYPRKNLKGKTPYALAVGLVPRRLLDEPGISSARESATTREGVSTDKSKASANVAFSSAALRSGL